MSTTITRSGHRLAANDLIIPTVVIPTPALTGRAQRLQEERSERLRLLARLAEERGLTAQLEAPGQYVLRDPQQPGVCQLATPFTCTCSGYGIWRRCEHVALVRKAEGLI